MRYNSLMEPLWEGSQLLELASLPEETRDVLAGGWQVGPAGSLLLASLYGSGWRTDWAPEDVAQHELEVNDLHISSQGAPEERGQFLVEMVSRARTAACFALKAADTFPSSELLVAVISVGIEDDYLPHGATVKILTHRGGYPRWLDDLDKFRLEAMALMEPRDIGCD